MGEEAPSLGEIVAELRRLAERLRGLGLRSLILFGSWARGEPLRESDVDVLIVAEGFRGKPFYEREELVLRLHDGRLPIEPWCYTPEEVVEALTRKPRIDVVDAAQNGIVVYDDGFWAEAARLAKRWARTRYGGVKLDQASA